MAIEPWQCGPRQTKTHKQAMCGPTADGDNGCYLLTGQPCPKKMSVGEKFWAYLTSRQRADFPKKGGRLIDM